MTYDPPLIVVDEGQKWHGARCTTSHPIFQLDNLDPYSLERGMRIREMRYAFPMTYVTSMGVTIRFLAAARPANELDLITAFGVHTDWWLLLRPTFEQVTNCDPIHIVCSDRIIGTLMGTVPKPESRFVGQLFMSKFESWPIFADWLDDRGDERGLSLRKLMTNQGQPEAILNSVGWVPGADTLAVN